MYDPAAGEPTGSRRSASCPGNPARGRDAHPGVVLMSSAQTGEPLAVMNASAVTEIRTAAVSAVATSLLRARLAGCATMVIFYGEAPVDRSATARGPPGPC
jgi:ornithine cyclodeaminase/alanine dehydrogenase-like protein (mu-crystallin family)